MTHAEGHTAQNPAGGKRASTYTATPRRRSNEAGRQAARPGACAGALGHPPSRYHSGLSEQPGLRPGDTLRRHRRDPWGLPGLAAGVGPAHVADPAPEQWLTGHPVQVPPQGQQDWGLTFGGTMSHPVPIPRLSCLYP